MEPPSDPAASELPLNIRQSLIDFLHAETLQQDTQMRSNMNQVYQFGILAFTVLGTAATILAQQGQYVALLALAPVAITIWLLGLRTQVELWALVANRLWHERRLAGLVNNAGAGDIFVPWDDAAGQVTSKSIANAAVFAAFAIAALAICIGSIVISWQRLPNIRVWTIIDMLVCAVFAIAAVISAVELLLIPSRIEQLLARKPELVFTLVAPYCRTEKTHCLTITYSRLLPYQGADLPVLVALQGR